MQQSYQILGCKPIQMISGLPVPDNIRGLLGQDSSWFSSLIWSDYFLLRWRGIGTFAVSNQGHSIHYEVDSKTPSSVIQAYLLNQVLSMALIRQGHDTLHGVACEYKGQALLFLAGSGVGKSSLLIHLLKHGARFISDDLLITHRTDSTFYVQQGFPHIKLYSDSLKYAGIQFDLVDALSPYTEKKLCRLASKYVHPDSLIRIGRVFVVDAALCPDVSLEALKGVEKFSALASNVFNSLDEDVARKKLNLKYVASWSHLPVIRLRYPRRYDIMDSLVSRIFESLNEDPQTFTN